MDEITTPAIRGHEHWAEKGSYVKLFPWEKCAGDPAKTLGTILFVHRSTNYPRAQRPAHRVEWSAARC
jgi:hypothetical protein